LSETEFDTLTHRLVGAFIVMFALLTLTEFHNPGWGYVAAAWAGGMAIPTYRWYAEMFKA
jgi:hypothetical protein